MRWEWVLSTTLRQWWYVSLRMNLDTTSCRRAGGWGWRRRRGCFQGGPLWLQQASVAPRCPYILPTPTPSTHPLSPSQPVAGVADRLSAGLSQQMAAVRQPWGTGQGLASGELLAPYTPKGANPGSWHIQRYTVQRQCRQAGSLRWRLQHLLTMEALYPLFLPKSHTSTEIIWQSYSNV